MDYKATKIQKGSKTFVVVTDADGNEVARLGGKRAERAAAVIVSEAHRYCHEDDHTEFNIKCRCRQDLPSAQQYAAKETWRVCYWRGDAYKVDGETYHNFHKTDSADEPPTENRTAELFQSAEVRSVAVRID